MDKNLLNEIKRSKEIIYYAPGTNKLTETFDHDILEEGVKDWVLGASLLVASIMNVGKAEAQIKALPPTKADTTITAINSIINDQDKLNQVAGYLKDNGYTGNVKQSLITHGNQVIQQIQQTKGGEIETITTSDAKEVQKLIKSGDYAITKANIQTVIDTLYPEVEVIPVVNVSLQGSSDEFFDFAKMDLKSDIKTEISSYIDSLRQAGYIITKAQVVSGTDYVRIDPTGNLKQLGIDNNEELAAARADTIKNYLTTLNIDSSLITTCTYPHNVENKQGYQPDESLRIAGIVIEAVKPQLDTPAGNIEINKSTTADFELAKVSPEKTKPTDGGSGQSIHQKIKKIKTKQKIGKKNKKQVMDTFKCPTFN